MLSDKRLAEIRTRYDARYEDLDPQHGARWDEMAVEELEHIGELLADHDRLCTELAAARERIAEARSILRVVANAEALNNHRAEVWARAGDWMLVDRLDADRLEAQAAGNEDVHKTQHR